MCSIFFLHCATLFWNVKLFAGEMYTPADKQQLHLRVFCPSHACLSNWPWVCCEMAKMKILKYQAELLLFFFSFLREIPPELSLWPTDAMGVSKLCKNASDSLCLPNDFPPIFSSVAFLLAVCGDQTKPRVWAELGNECFSRVNSGKRLGKTL